MEVFTWRHRRRPETLEFASQGPTFRAARGFRPSAVFSASSRRSRASFRPRLLITAGKKIALYIWRVQRQHLARLQALCHYDLNDVAAPKLYTGSLKLVRRLPHVDCIPRFILDDSAPRNYDNRLHLAGSDFRLELDPRFHQR